MQGSSGLQCTVASFPVTSFQQESSLEDYIQLSVHDARIQPPRKARILIIVTFKLLSFFICLCVKSR